jgi:hypothetical protein
MDWKWTRANKFNRRRRMIMSAVAEKIDSVQAGLERTGTAFTVEKMLAVRGITRTAIHEIAARCKPGMVGPAWWKKTL